MLGAPADGLHGSPHVSSRRQQVPAGRDELVRVDAAAFVEPLQRAAHGMVDHDGPHDVAVAADDRVGAAELVRFVGIQGGVDSAVDDGRAARSQRDADLVPAQRIAGVDADADDVAGLNGVEIELLERFIDDARPSVLRRRRRAENEQPSRRDDADAKGQMARIHEVDSHRTP